MGNLPYSTTSDELATLFGRVGVVTSAQVIMDRETGRSRGFGFVEMSSDDEARRAIAELNGSELQGRKIGVSEARERGEQGPTRNVGAQRSFGPDLPPSRPRFRKEGGSRRGLRGRKRSL